MFITLEGTEGSGKTTQIRYIEEYLNYCGIQHVVSREPGGTIIGEQIRSVLLDINNTQIDPAVELLLCIADRIQHINDVIRPSIDNGMIVVCDRYVDSTLVYQGFARGVNASTIWYLHDILCSGLMPDITLLMDLDPAASLLRARKRVDNSTKANDSRFEQENIYFHERIRNGYLELAKSEPNRFHLINASIDENQVKEQIKTVIEKQLLYKKYFN